MTPNNQQEIFFLATLAEESGELAQAAGKSIRFTLSDKKRGKLVEELSDVIAAAALIDIHPDPARIQAKLEKLRVQAASYQLTGSGDCGKKKSSRSDEEPSRDDK